QQQRRQRDDQEVAQQDAQADLHRDAFAVDPAREIPVRPERRRVAPKSKDAATMPFDSAPAALRSGRTGIYVSGTGAIEPISVHVDRITQPAMGADRVAR